MDVFSHGLWGGILLGRKNKKSFWTAFAFGVAPDVLSFGVFTFMTVLGLSSGPDWSGGPPDPSLIPAYVHMLYNITHSMVIFAAAFGIVFAIRRKPLFEMFAWLFHILLDIPTHSAEFFPTPFLWPVSSYHISGVPWSHPAIFVPNVVLLVLTFSYFWWKKRSSQKA